MYAALKNRFYDWLFQLHGRESGVIVLVQRRVFILPTRQGLMFAVVLLVMLTGSINYTLGLGFVLTFLLAALGVNAMIHTFRNLANLQGNGRPLASGVRRRHRTIHGAPRKRSRYRPLRHRPHPGQAASDIRRRA